MDLDTRVICPVCKCENALYVIISDHLYMWHGWTLQRIKTWLYIHVVPEKDKR